MKPTKEQIESAIKYLEAVKARISGAENAEFAIRTILAALESAQADSERLDHIAQYCFFPDDHPSHGIFICAANDAIPHGGYGINEAINNEVIRAAIDAARKSP